MGVYPFVFFFMLLSWTAQQAQCQQTVEETKKAEGVTVQAPGSSKQNCKDMVCFYRNGANSQRGQKPNKPADWKEKDFLHGYDRCTKEFNVTACKVICDGSKDPRWI